MSKLSRSGGSALAALTRLTWYVQVWAPFPRLLEVNIWTALEGGRGPGVLG